VTLSIGVDLGATWLRATGAENGVALWTARRPAVPWREAPIALRALLRLRGSRRAASLCVGGTRLGAARDRVLLRRLLSPLAAKVEVLTDYELAHRAAFGRGPGVLLVASTGAIAFARPASGAGRRAGGLGPLLGDEGSGFWLGREAVRDERIRRALRLPKALDLAHAKDPVRATAALGARVLRAASTSRGARLLRERAADHLAGLARDAARSLPLPRPAPLALHGSLFKDAGLRVAVTRRLGRGFRVVAAAARAQDAAAGVFARIAP
jgi:hypothetical protein